MKVVFITREGYNLAGARVRCYKFARELKKYGIETEVLSFADNLGAKHGASEWQMGIREKLLLNYRALRILLKKRDAVFYLQRFNYHSFAPYLAHLFKRNRIILDVDDWEIRENLSYYLGFWPNSKAEFFTRWIASKSAVCIAASQYLQRYLSQFNKRTYYLPSGVNTDLFRLKDKEKDDSHLTFSWIGSIHNHDFVENVNFIVECFLILREKYNNIYLEIRGDGLCFREFVELLRNKNDNHIILKGWISPEDMPGYLAGIDVGLVPLIQETSFNKAKSPVKLFEYMAMGKPTVCSYIGEPINIIKDGENGLLAKNKEEFMVKMEELIKNKSLRRRLGQKAREAVEAKYSLKVIAKKLYEILKTIYA